MRVANSGAQIEPTDAQALTEPFRRLDGARGGFGLGLSIVRSVVEAHGGVLTAANRQEGGSVFTVTLPGFHDHSAPLCLEPSLQTAAG